MRYRLGGIDEMSDHPEERFWGLIDVRFGYGLQEEPESKSEFDLAERTARFGAAIIRFAQKIPPTPVNTRLISQLVGAGTSVGANFCEADEGVSKKDFRNKVGTCRKEAKETKYWSRMVAVAEPRLKAEARILWQEAKELNLIFGAIWRKG